MVDTVKNFGELVGLMVWGTGEPDSFRGVIRRVEAGDERRYRLVRRGNLLREEDLDGTVNLVVGMDATWFRDPEAGAMRVQFRELQRYVDYVHSWPGGLDVGGPRPSWARWAGTDFTRPTGPVTETQFFGRPAWAVELAPPSHKPYPLQLVVDGETGVLLRKTNADFGTVEEFVELDLQPDLSDALFVWDGPVKPFQSRADHEAEEQAEREQRRAWLRQRGLATLRVPIDFEVDLHDWDDVSGSLYADIYETVSAALIRRAHSDTPWEEPETTHYPHSWRWSGGSWDWFFASDFRLTELDLQAIKAQLAFTT